MAGFEVLRMYVMRSIQLMFLFDRGFEEGLPVVFYPGIVLSISERASDSAVPQRRMFERGPMTTQAARLRTCAYDGDLNERCHDVYRCR